MGSLVGCVHVVVDVFLFIFYCGGIFISFFGFLGGFFTIHIDI